jgi:hypothetical protein
MSGGGCLRSPSHSRKRLKRDRMPKVYARRYAGAGAPS